MTFNIKHSKIANVVATVLAMCVLSCSHATNAAAQGAGNVNFLGGGATPFSEAVRVGSLLILSGQLGLQPGTPNLVAGGVANETQQAMANVKSTLERYGYSMKDVVKCSVSLIDMADFAVFNKTYLSNLTAPYPARTLVGVKSLAFGARVEIECMAAK